MSGTLSLILLDCLLNNAVFHEGPGCHLVLFLRDAEEENGRDAQVFRLLHFFHQMINGHLKISGHGTDRFFHILSEGRKKRINEIIDGQLRLP